MTVYYGLFENEVHNLPDQSVDLVMTSPPYANQRLHQYGGIDEENYPAWTVMWMSHLKRVLKPTGSVIINIRPHVRNGELSDFMLHTRLAVRADGWRENDEWIWYKPDSPPLGDNNRPRRSWESLHWFSLKGQKAYCNPHANGVSTAKIGFAAKKGLGQIYSGKSDGFKDGTSRDVDIFGAAIADIDRSEFNTHPAQFPMSLAQQIIKCLCPAKGMVIDPFLGSGTTAIAAIKEERNWAGFEKEPEYVEIAKRRIKDTNFLADEFFRMNV